MVSYKDYDGLKVTEGDKISFSYGIPPVSVVAPIVRKNGVLTVLTPGHNPNSCPLSKLKEYVGQFWKEQQDDQS